MRILWYISSPIGETLKAALAARLNMQAFCMATEVAKAPASDAGDGCDTDPLGLHDLGIQALVRGWDWLEVAADEAGHGVGSFHRF